MFKAGRKKLIQDWQDHCDMIKRLGTIPVESQADKVARIKRAKRDYRYFFQWYFPHYAKFESAWFHIRVANKLIRFPKFTAILPWFRGAAKSVHGGLGYPIWLKINNELKVMLLVGDTSTKACRLLGDLQAELEHNPRFIHDFGEQYSHGDWSEGDFVTTDDCAFFGIGIGQSPRGARYRENRPDYIFVDDVDTKKRCKNERLTREAAEWVMEDLMGCFDNSKDARERLVIANNIIHKKSIVSRLINRLTTAWVLMINAIDKNGNPTWPEKNTAEYWEQKQKEIPHRSFQREYQNNPIEDGAIFKSEWIQWKKALPLNKYDHIVGYGDLSYRATGDYKAYPIMGRIGKEIHIIKAFVRQSSIPAVAGWVYDYNEGIPQNAVVHYYIEGSFIQDDFANQFDQEGEIRGKYIPVIPDKRKKPDKHLRIEQLAGHFHRGNVYFNEDEKDNNDMQTLVDQFLAFEKGSAAADDGPDAVEGGMFFLQKRAAAGAFEPLMGDRQHDNIY